ncbi:MAG: ORF6N domain-containing protein [Acidobacteriota bacterium]
MRHQVVRLCEPWALPADLPARRSLGTKKTPKSDLQIIPLEAIERRIYLIRGQKVMLDSDLAELYGVETFNLNKAVKRNIDRFPGDFMFQLTSEEAARLRFQIGMSKPSGRGGRRYLPYAFTEQGVAMLSSVLRSERAVQVNILIMRAFVRLREILGTHRDLALKLEALEKKYDAKFKVVFDAIRELMAPTPVPQKRQIGFSPKEGKDR